MWSSVALFPGLSLPFGLHEQLGTYLGMHETRVLKLGVHGPTDSGHLGTVAS